MCHMAVITNSSIQYLPSLIYLFVLNTPMAMGRENSPLNFFHFSALSYYAVVDILNTGKSEI